jgi:hypothetical protein
MVSGWQLLMPYQVLPFIAHRPGQPDQSGATAAQAGERTRIVVSAHERLVVTYSEKDDTVYLFCPPGQDPVAVLGAARLVLHDQSYQELAWCLGMASSWQAEWEATG